jgi:methionyl-tRNA formyltransferase
MKKKALIISDNFSICSKIKLINDKLGIGDNFNYSTSIYSSINDFYELDKNAIQYDLKNERNIKEIIQNFKIVFSIHSKQIFPQSLIKNCRCYNLHPGYNPINRGWYPQVFAILNDTQVGATLHEIDEYLDHGKIIDRQFVIKDSWDTSFTLYNKIVEKECDIWERNVLNVLNNSYTVIEPESDGNIYFKKDFNKLLQLDLDEKLSMKQCIDKLRALTFHGYDNAFFIDDKGNKVFVSIILKLNE